MPKVVKLHQAKRNVVAFRLTDEEQEILTTIAKELHITKSEVIHFLLREALEQIHGIKFGGEEHER